MPPEPTGTFAPSSPVRSPRAHRYVASPVRDERRRVLPLEVAVLVHRAQVNRVATAYELGHRGVGELRVQPKRVGGPQVEERRADGRDRTAGGEDQGPLRAGQRRSDALECALDAGAEGLPALEVLGVVLAAGPAVHRRDE